MQAVSQSTYNPTQPGLSYIAFRSPEGASETKGRKLTQGGSPYERYNFYNKLSVLCFMLSYMGSC